MDFLTFFDNDFKAVMPELYLFCAILILLSYGVVFSTSKELNYPIIQFNVGWLTILSIFISFFLLLDGSFTAEAGYIASVFNGQLIIDPFSTFTKGLILLSSAVCSLMSLSYLEYKKVNSFEYFLLILFATLGMVCLVSSNDLLALYMSIELMSLSFYILASYKRNSEFSGEAGLKYFILGAFSSGLLLFGMSLIYGFTGLTNFEELAKLLTGINNSIDVISYNGILLGILFVSFALLFKVAAAPFHMWSPDVYEGAPMPVTAFFSIVPKVAIFALFLRLFYSTFYDFLGFWQPIFLYCSIVSMIVGSIGALYQKKLKRLMAYSGIANVGYMLAGLSAATVESAHGLIFFLLVYVITLIAFFSFMLGTFTNKDSKMNTQISDLVNLGAVNPVLAFSIVFILFSMIGLPPLAGFFAKYYLFLSMIQSELYMLAIIGVLSSVIAAFYYIRLIKVMFFEVSPNYLTYKTMDKINALILSSSLFILVFLFAWPHPVLSCIHNIAITLVL